MKKYFVLITLIYLIVSLSAKIEFEQLPEAVLLNYTNSDVRIEETEYTLAVPAVNIELIIESCQISEYDKAGNLIESRSDDGKSFMEYTGNFVMRDLNAHRVLIKNSQETEKGVRILNNLKMKLSTNEIIPIPDQISASFLPLYKMMADNFDRSYLISAEIVPSKMLVIAPNNAVLLSTLELFKEWKNARGIETNIVTLDETGNTASSIKNYLQEIYETEEVPPDFVVLVGDVEEQGNPYHLPSFFIGVEQDVTDHPYTMLEGEDYFPELLIGRFSIDDAQDLYNIVSKIVNYEKNPYLTDPSWFEKALIAAGNYSGSPPYPVTPVQVSKWLKEKLIDYGYDQVSEVYFPPTYPGTDQIINAINEGVGFASYRGWGNANGWEFPDFDRTDIADLNNGLQLPVVTSIVCNTCDFANSVDPCFGEAFIQKDNGGCVSIVGPSDLHTSTEFNNAIFSGFYYGLLDEAIHTFGTAVLRGKLELYENYPLDQDPDGDVEFYYHVYNILGDPSLSMWTAVPETISCDMPEYVSLGLNHLELDLPDLDGGIATAMKQDEFLEIGMIENDQVTLFLDPQTTGEITITITKANHKPYINSINVVQEDIDVGLEEYSTNVELSAGNIVDINITLKNYGNQTASSVTANLATESQYITINDDFGDYGDLSPAQSATESYQFTIDPECPDQETVSFDLLLSTGQTAKIEMIISSVLFSVTDFYISDANGFLDPGETSNISVTIQNMSSIYSQGIEAEVISLCDAVEITSGTMVFGDLNANETASDLFEVSVNSDCVIGRQATFELTLSDNSGHTASTHFTVEIGEVTNSTPTGPDSYGYYAYDNFDVDNEGEPFNESPTYFWEEIDPALGGSGSVFEMGDDSSESVPLPFSFKYYGVDHDSITICSNGWISFQTTWYANFRNWSIPSAIGPYAMVAAYWDDLIGPLNGSEHDPMRICYYYEEDQDRFIIEWNECVNRHDNSSVEKFELILYDPSIYQTGDGNGEIQVNYHTINNPDDNGNYSTLGIENHLQSDGLLYSYANLFPASASPLQSGLAIKYTTDPPDIYTPYDDDLLPSVFLVGNYPNPFNPSTTIRFNLEQESEVILNIYNLKGQLIKILTQENYSAGIHELVWDGRNETENVMPSGIYFYKLSAAGKTAIKKCVLMK